MIPPIGKATYTPSRPVTLAPFAISYSERFRLPGRDGIRFDVDLPRDQWRSITPEAHICAAKGGV